MYYVTSTIKKNIPNRYIQTHTLQFKYIYIKIKTSLVIFIKKIHLFNKNTFSVRFDTISGGFL